MLRAILSNQNISLYQLEKISHISHATLNDIYNERSNISNCSVLVMSKLANSLNMDIDSLYKKLIYDDLSLFTYSEDFDLFKSNTLQRLKSEGEEKFLKRVEDDQLIEGYYKYEKYLEAFYLLSLADYLYAKNKKPLLKQYDVIRSLKLTYIYVPKSIYLLLMSKRITVTQIYKESIKEFWSHNIVEALIDDVI